ncbi:MAG: inositol monophosphatase family protein [Thermoplasmata archaeon]
MRDAEWLGVFRSLGRRAGRAAGRLYGTKTGRRELGRGAAGDTTVFLDRALEKLVIGTVRRAGNVRLISEEAGVMDFGEPEVCIIADPLDGSVNAKAGVPFFSVSYALAPLEPRMADVRVGYVRNLVSGDEYWAFKGGGAFKNGKRIRASNQSTIELLLMELSPGHRKALRVSRGLLEQTARVRCLGSVALDFCLVASGVASALVDFRGGLLRTLDQCAGKLILEEAGGLVTDESGGTIDHLSVDLTTRTDIIAAANRRVLDRVVRARWG